MVVPSASPFDKTELRSSRNSSVCIAIRFTASSTPVWLEDSCERERTNTMVGRCGDDAVPAMGVRKGMKPTHYRDCGREG